MLVSAWSENANEFSVTAALREGPTARFINVLVYQCACSSVISILTANTGACMANIPRYIMYKKNLLLLLW